MYQLYYSLDKLCCEFLSIPSPLLFTVEALHRNSLFFISFTHTPFLINYPHYLAPFMETIIYNCQLQRSSLTFLSLDLDTYFEKGSYCLTSHKLFSSSWELGGTMETDFQAVSQEPKHSKLCILRP